MAFRHPGVFCCDGGAKGRLKALGFVLEDPLCLPTPTRTRFDPKRLWDPAYPYIGRGYPQSGIERSAWANPFSVRAAGSRAKAIEQFRSHLAMDRLLLPKVSELEGRKLMCHCDLSEECHADVLIEEFEKYAATAADRLGLPPPEDEEVRAEAVRRREAVGRGRPKVLEGREEPTANAGEGPPVYVYQGHLRRVLSEGGGLCSPGLAAGAAARARWWAARGQKGHNRRD